MLRVYCRTAEGGGIVKPFCFRCGEEPKYQLSLQIKGKEGIEEGPFWPLCFKCFMKIPWDTVLRPTVQGYEDREKEVGL